MNELVTVTADWFLDTWADGPTDNPHDHLHEYIIDPEPLADEWYDEGDGD